MGQGHQSGGNEGNGLVTNLDRFRYYCDPIFSPDPWINLGWIFTCLAALERRVWYGQLNERAMFCNMYIVLCGPPATGKGLILDVIEKLLKHHKVKMSIEELKKAVDKKDDMCLLAHGPSDLTYERLTQTMARTIRKLTYRELDAQGKQQTRIYTHSSMYFTLAELDSLFKKDAPKIPKFLLQTYDCKDYDYETKHNDNDRIRNPCLSFVAGCTPETISEAAKFKIFTDGFVARTIFCFEKKSRKNPFRLADVNKDQIRARDHCLEHVGKLTKLFGQIQVDDETWAYLEEWYEAKMKDVEKCASPKMQQFYARLRAHVMKLAAGFHFSEHTHFEIGLESFKMAIKVLDYLATQMKWGFNLTGRNELHPIAMDIARFINTVSGHVSRAELIGEFGADVTLTELDEILMQLLMTNRIKSNGDYFMKKGY